LHGIDLLHEEEVKRAFVLIAWGVCSAYAADATYTVKILTPETALKAAQAALKNCRDRGFQASVAVVDRMGVVQVLLRDRFAGPHTPDMATARLTPRSAFAPIPPSWPSSRSPAAPRAASATAPASPRSAAG
jgi:hypothetical protein